MPTQLRFGVFLGAVVAMCGAVGVAQTPPASAVRVDLFAVRDGAPVDDLRQDELQILEDGVPQTIESFEHVTAGAGGHRSRVFVIFLDTYHSTIEDESTARLPLVRVLDRLLDRDDLVALTTPELSAADLTFRKKAEVLSDIMQAEWSWARHGQRRPPGSKEVLYDQCVDPSRAAERARAEEMKARWREQMTLDALDDLVEHLGPMREERKAVLTVSDGWQLFTPSRTLGEPDDERSSRSDRRRRFGSRGAVPGEQATPVMRVECEADRRRLASLDDSQRLRGLGEAANRDNVSFYPLYAPEVTVPPQGVSRPVPDNDHGAARVDSLRLLADATDGLAVLKRGAIDEAIPRILADESSYYLVSYRSTNATLDGRFRALGGRVSRPGVKLRMRRGYRGPTTEELLSSGRPVGSRSERPLAAPAAVTDVRRPFRIRTSSWVSADGGTFWIVGELDYRTRRELSWTAGATADVVVLAADGTQLFSESVPVKPDEGGFSVRVPEHGDVKPGEYAVQVQLRPDANDSLVLQDTARVVLGANGEDLGMPVVWRRGPSTGPRHLRTADTRFSRSERIRLELPTTVPGTATARMLDRVGQLIHVPVRVSARPDDSGQFRWIVAEATLAPLAPGQYTIEVSLGTVKRSFELTLVP